jgi:hypothetical protein
MNELNITNGNIVLRTEGTLIELEKYTEKRLNKTLTTRSKRMPKLVVAASKRCCSGEVLGGEES